MQREIGEDNEGKCDQSILYMYGLVKKIKRKTKLKQVNEIILVRDNDILVIERTVGVDFRLVSKDLFIC